MELKIHARNVDVTSRLQEHVEKKVKQIGSLSTQYSGSACRPGD